MAGLRAMVTPHKGKMRGVAAREAFDAIMKRVVAPQGVTFQPGTVGGISGWWCKPTHAASNQVLLHLHGGWYNWGSAAAFCHLVGHIAKRVGVKTFIPDYRLAPEHPFPAAPDDVQACYDGLVASGWRNIAISGDSAGGGLALGLLAAIMAKASKNDIKPLGVVVLSPVTDLTFAGSTWKTRADVDPYFTHAQAAELVSSYLGGHDPADPLASPLLGSHKGLPPLRVHVGDDEVLLDDSSRYVTRVVAAGGDAKLDIWEGMPHGFVSGVGRISTANQALDAISDFLKERLMLGVSA